jgi:hypothetical protein
LGEVGDPRVLEAAGDPRVLVAPGAGERPTITQRVEQALHVTHHAKRQGFRVSASGPDTAAAPQVDEDASTNGNHAP